MTEPTPVEYASFGAAVAGILDAFNDVPEAESKYVVTMIQMAARQFNIQTQEHNA